MARNRRTSAHKRSNTKYNRQFSHIPAPKLARSTFNRSHNIKTAFSSGFLIPILADEILPGDTLRCRFTQFSRMTTMLRPVFENIYMDTFFFFVPNRLLFDNWQKFMGEQENPTDPVDFELPLMNSGTGYLEESLSDYLGLPIGVPNMEHHSLFHRAYALIYNEWFRSQDLIDSIPFDTGPGPDDPADYELQRRGKRHDYFTACLPWPTKGGQGVELPLGLSAPVSGNVNITGDGSPPQFDYGAGAVTIDAYASSSPNLDTSITGSTGTLNWSDPHLDGVITGGTADLSAASSATINQIREAFQIQKLFERDARGGTRYTELVRSHFGQIMPDQQWRPEYLGGGSTRININPVAATENLSGGPTNTLGDLGAYGTAVGQSGFNKSFVEHGVVLGLVMVRADLHYQQGLDRMFTRRDRLDFFWPALQHLGEQEVLSSELYAEDGAGSAGDTLVFGYQSRYDEYRHKQSRITGKMRSTATVPLDFLHLAQEFGPTAPVLNKTFIEENPPLDRILAIEQSEEPAFQMDGWFDYHHARVMPTYGVPGLIDHF